MSPDTPAADTPSDGLSRRHLIRRAAAVGAAGLAVTLVTGPAAVADTEPDAGPDAGPDDPAGAEPVDHDEPMIVHVRDARTGHLDLFTGERHHRIQDTGLAAALVRAFA